MKRVVTGVDDEGRSTVLVQEELDASTPHTLWSHEPKDVSELVAAVDPAISADWIGPAEAGGVICRYTTMPPGSEAGSGHGPLPGIDENGFHTTRTIDIDFVVAGEIVMVLDTERVALNTGDVVVQQATRHAWRNETDAPAVLLAVLTRPVSD